MTGNEQRGEGTLQFDTIRAVRDDPTVQAVVFASTVVGFTTAALLSTVINPAWVWGGDVCRDTAQFVNVCGVPPLGMVGSLLLCNLVGAKLLDRHHPILRTQPDE